MAEEKKDLTGLLQYSKALEEAGQAPPIPTGSVMEEIPLEKIEAFETLEDYSIHNPPPPLPEPGAAATEPAPDPLVASETAPTSDFPESPAPPPNEDPFQVTSPSPESEKSDPASPSESPTSDSISEASGGAFDPPPGDSAPDNLFSNDFAGSTSDLGSFPSNDNAEIETPSPMPSLSAEPADGFSSAAFTPAASGPTETPPESDLFATPPAPSPPSPPAAVPAKPTPSLEKIKHFVEQTPPARMSVPAAFPFSVMILGPLFPEEKDKISELVDQEKMGILSTDLEPQLSSGRILIPRISEYAGIMIVQALRGSRAQIKLGPSDSIFATSDTRTTPEEDAAQTVEDHSSSLSSEISHPAEEIPVTSENQLPGLSHYKTIDTISASATLKAQIVEAESSSEYHEILEALHREIKYKAYRRGATAVLNFKIQLNALSSPTHYRILTTGSAVKPEPPAN